MKRVVITPGEKNPLYVEKYDYCEWDEEEEMNFDMPPNFEYLLTTWIVYIN